jgi:hypothetical protein
MAVDLKSYTTFGRNSLVVMNDALIKLEHGYTQDRVRKFSYETVQDIIVWRKHTIGRIIIVLIAFVLSGIAVFFIGNTAATIIAIILLSIGSLLTCWYLYCKKTTIRIVRSGQHHDIVGIFRPGKLRRFLYRLVTAVRTAQAAVAAQATVEQTVSPPPSPMPSDRLETPIPAVDQAPSGSFAAP